MSKILNDIELCDDLAEIMASFPNVLEVSYFDGIKMLTMYNADNQVYRNLSEMCSNFYELCLDNDIFFIRRDASYGNTKGDTFRYYRINKNNTSTFLGDVDAVVLKKISRECKIRSILD